MKLSDRRVVSRSSATPTPLEKKNSSGDEGRMETRISALESLAEKTLERIKFLEVDLAVIKSNYATKEDIAELRGEIAKLEGDLLKWFIGTAVALAGIAFAAARFIH